VNTKHSRKRFRRRTLVVSGFVAAAVAGVTAVGINSASAAPAGEWVVGQGGHFEEAYANARSQCDSGALRFRTIPPEEEGGQWTVEGPCL